jgi:hypothetical protein
MIRNITEKLAYKLDLTFCLKAVAPSESWLGANGIEHRLEEHRFSYLRQAK